jgi:hypothetical protein
MRVAIVVVATVGILWEVHREAQQAERWWQEQQVKAPAPAASANLSDPPIDFSKF